MESWPKYSVAMAAGLIFAALLYVPQLHSFVFVPPALFLFYLRRAKTREDAVFGMAVGMFIGVFFVIRTLNPDPDAWLFISRALSAHARQWLSPFLTVLWLVVAAWLALPYVLAGLVARIFMERYQGKLFAVAGLFAVLWAGAEFLRAKIFFGFPWADLGYYVFNAFPTLGIWGRFTGVYGLSFLAALVGGLAFVIYEHRKITFPVFAAGLVVLLLATVGWTKATLERAHWAQAKTPALVFQGVLAWGSFGPYQKVTSGFSFPESYAQLFEQARKGANARNAIAVFPEEILPAIDPEQELYQWQEEKRGLNFIRQELGASLLTIGQPIKHGEQTINASLLLDGSEPRIYAKRRLFPLVEYMPFGGRWLNNAFLFKPPGFTPGSGTQAGLLSCMEALMPDLVRKEVDAGAPILISGGSEIAWEWPVWQHDLLISRFNAMQNQRYMLRAMKEGYSAIINPLGETILQSNGRENVVLAGYVTLIGK